MKKHLLTKYRLVRLPFDNGMVIGSLDVSKEFYTAFSRVMGNPDIFDSGAMSSSGCYFMHNNFHLVLATALCTDGGVIRLPIKPRSGIRTIDFYMNSSGSRLSFSTLYVAFLKGLYTIYSRVIMNHHEIRGQLMKEINK
jgi:hypothetical protein